MKKRTSSIKAWTDINVHLEEFNGIPSSQTSIDCYSSEEDESNEPHPVKLPKINLFNTEKFLNGCSNGSNSKDRMNNVNNSTQAESILKTIENKLSSQSAANSFNERGKQHPINVIMKQQTNEPLANDNLSIDGELISRIIPSQKKYKVEQNQLAGSISTSPIFKSNRRKRPICKAWHKTPHSRTDEKKVDAFTSQEVEKCSNVNEQRRSLFSSPERGICYTAEESAINMAHKYKDLANDDIHIDNIPSPVFKSCRNSLQQSFDSSNIEYRSSSEVDDTPKNIKSSRTGSVMIKKLQCSTPEIQGAAQSDIFYGFEPPDLERKKTKRNGHADRFEKLLHSWKSSYYMWNHQVSSIMNKNDRSCDEALDSPSSSLSSVPSNIKSLRSLRSSLDIDSPSPKHLTSWRNVFKLPKKKFSVQVSDRVSQGRGTFCMEWKAEKETSNIFSKNEELKKFLVYFAKYDKKELIFKHGDIITIYAPWQSMTIHSDLSAIFCSFYYQEPSAKCLDECKIIPRKRTEIAVWFCSCTESSRKTDLSSRCCSGKFISSIPEEDNAIPDPLPSPTALSLFSVVRESPEVKLPEKNRIWLIQEAVELCGGMPDILVSVTIRILRVLPMRSRRLVNEEPCTTAANNTISHYTIIGQDPSGIFLVVEVPNCPLTTTLQKVLSDGTDTTQTLTHLSTAQRLTNNQDVGLFWLITSLHLAYQNSLKVNPHLATFIPEQLRKEPQTFCYKFHVTLGKTENILIAENEGPKFVLPELNLIQLNGEADGRRGFINAILLYRIDSYLYFVTQNGTAELQCRKPTERLVKKIKLMCTDNLPSWLSNEAAFITSVIIHDAVICNGRYIMDEYSTISRIDREECDIPSSDCVKNFIPLYDPSALCQSIVLVNGRISGVNETDACFWQECPGCGGSGSGEEDVCSLCGKKENITNRFHLRVLIKLDDDGLAQPHSQHEVEVNLFQKTIKKLLDSITRDGKMEYDANSLLQKRLDYLICYLDESEATTMLLRELPY